MAIVAAIKGRTQSKVALRKVMDYVAQDKKTMFHDHDTGQSYRLTSGQNCVAETAYREFMATKLQHGKDYGVFYKQFVQSFKPGKAASPKEIHRMGVELASYFKGFEVLVATHIDEDHWHNHLIVNSVNTETGLKIQFDEKSLNKLRQRSDEICRAHGLETLKPYRKDSPMAGMNTREFRAAVKGDSWKFKLMSAIDSALASCGTKAGFIFHMERMGYGVKWIDHYKHITYTTPEGHKCRDNRLHEEKYLKERMESHFEHGQAKGFEQAGKSDRGIQRKGAVLRNPAGDAERSAADAGGNRQASGTHAGAHCQIADMGGLDNGDSADNLGNHERTYCRSRQMPAVTGTRFPERDVRIENKDHSDTDQQIEGIGRDAPSAGYDTLEVSSQMGRNRGIDIDDVLGIALALENLLVDPQRKAEERKKQAEMIKNQRKRNRQRSHEWDMSR